MVLLGNPAQPGATEGNWIRTIQQGLSRANAGIKQRIHLEGLVTKTPRPGAHRLLDVSTSGVPPGESTRRRGRTRGLPTGTVTFLFTDIQGSTELLQELGPDFLPTRDRHDRAIRAAIEQGAGIEIATEGDSFFAVFPTAVGAVRAAVAAQRALAAAPEANGRRIEVRMGLHTGDGQLGGDSYVGMDVHRAARIGDAGHGGQVLLSDATRALVESQLPDGVTLRFADADAVGPAHADGPARRRA